MQTINLDLSTKNVIPLLHAKQGDVGKKFKVTITNDGKPYDLAGAVFSVWYAGPSGEGNYTNIGDSSAFSVVGSSVTVELITQMLTNAGKGKLCLVMNTAEGKKIGMWNIPYHVEEVPGAGSQEAKMYYDAFQKAVKDLPYPDETLTIPGKAADAAAVGRALTGAISIPAGDDLDRLVTPGRYACETAEIAGTLLSCPVDEPFTMDVRYANGVGPRVGQELRPAGTGARLYRQFVGFSEILSDEAKKLYDRMQTVKPQLYEYGGNFDIYDGTEDTAWYTGDKMEYVLEKASQLYGLAKLVNNGTTNFAGVTIKLGKDIVINEDDASTWGYTAPAHSWKPIGDTNSNWGYKSHFAGTLDGQGHYISGLYNVQGRDNGFMCWTINATVKHLAIINSYFENNGTNATNGQVLGALVGRGYGLTLQNVYSDAMVVCSAKDHHTGGLVGFAQSNKTIQNVAFNDASISNSVFAGKIVSTQTEGNLVGGILGGTDGSYAAVTNSLFVGTIESNDNLVGGIVGRIYKDTVITGCISAGAVNKKSGKTVGAVVGQLYDAGTYTITDCRYKDQGLELYGGKYNSEASATVTGSKALSAECIEHSMMPGKWAKVYDSENVPIPELVYCHEDNDGTIFENRLNQILAGMKEGQTKQIRFCCYPHISGVTFVGTLWKHRFDYATLHGVSYDGASVRKLFFEGKWGPHEWENPFMGLDNEYRTTERWNNKPVYTKVVNCGYFPAAASKEILHGIADIDQIISCEGNTPYVGLKLPYYSFANGQIFITASVHATRNALTVFASVGTWTMYRCYVTIKYTKTTD